MDQRSTKYIEIKQQKLGHGEGCSLSCGINIEQQKCVHAEYLQNNSGCDTEVSLQKVTYITKNAVFWNVAACRSCVNRRFRGTYRLHLQGRKNPRAGCSHLLKLVPRSRIFVPWRWSRYVPAKRRFTQDPHGATSRKTAFFIVNAVKTSNLTTYITFDPGRKVKRCSTLNGMRERKRETSRTANKQKDTLLSDGWEDQESSSQYFSFLLPPFSCICQPPFYSWMY
jgi:hypothetical protein